MAKRPCLLFLITEDWTFWEIRLPLARAARDAGYDVLVVTRVTQHAEKIYKEGFRLVSVSLVRSKHSLFHEVGLLAQLIRLYARERPQITHHVGLKPILYGSFAAWVTRIPYVLNLFAGLGYVFTDRPVVKLAQRFFVSLSLKLVIRMSRSVVVFQNVEDCDLLIKQGIVDPRKARLILGSGVDSNKFVPQDVSAGLPIVMFAGRMLGDKGVYEFVQAVRLLQKRKVLARFVMVGRHDQENPTSVDGAQIIEWVQNDKIEWWGHREDMADVLGGATLVVLPSYREGLSRVLLEAAACGKALIASDVPGCRGVVIHEETGLLVPVRDANVLAEAIADLLLDHVRRAAFGKAGRELILREFTEKKITRQFLSLYEELIGGIRS